MTTTDSRPPWRRVLQRRGHDHGLPWRGFAVVDGGTPAAAPDVLVIDGQPRCGRTKSNGDPCRSIVRVAGQPCEWHAPASWHEHQNGMWGRTVRN